MPEPRRVAVIGAAAVVAVALVVVVAVAYRQSTSGDTPATSTTTQPDARALLRRLPIAFIPNRGQTDRRVAYYAQQEAISQWFTQQGVTLALHGGRRAKPRRWVLRQALVGGRAVAPVAERRGGTIVSYFKGQRARWRAGLPTYGQLRYRDVWPGIDVAYAGSGGALEYTFLLRPEADPDAIRLAYRGASAVRLVRGRLLVQTPLGSLRDARPRAWQERKGHRVAVPVAFDLGAAGTYGFRLGPYDRSRPLVIDPTVVYAGYVGGAGQDGAVALALDGAGSAYVAGETFSDATTFPVAVGPDVSYNATGDGFIAKVNAAGTGLVYVGYIGGDGSDRVRGVDVDAAGNAFITGSTSSDEASFPVTSGPDLSYNGGSADGFVAQVDATGTGLLYAGYIGGAGVDAALSVAADAGGNAYVAGTTDSDETSFPVTVGPDLSFNGARDVFVAKVEAGGSALAYAGYVGGNAGEFAQDVTVDPAENLYVTGATESSETSFPVTVGPGLTYSGGNGDAFVAKVDAAGTDLAYAGYVGGNGIDVGRGIEVAGGYAYLTGETSSNETSFPVKVGPDLTYSGEVDAFVAKVNPFGTGLVYAGYVGGTELDSGEDIAVDAAGNAYVAGYTSSDESSFPVAAGPDSTYNGARDAFVAKVGAAGSALAYAGYVGGAAEDIGWDVAADAAGNAYVAGWSYSDQSTFPVAVGPDLTQNGDRDAFVVKVGGPPPLDHFKCYLARSFPVRRLVKLEDQFGTTRVVVNTTKTLCNPVSKNGEPIVSPEAHLKCYDLQRPVTTTNQFGTSRLTVDLARTLCTPASKRLSGRPPPPPAGLDHFQCYPLAKAPSASLAAKLRDQFRTEIVKVDRPVSLCNPVSKNGENLVNPTAHLVCYTIVGKPNSIAVRVRDQFRTEGLLVGDPTTVCLPSSKRALGG